MLMIFTGCAQQGSEELQSPLIGSSTTRAEQRAAQLPDSHPIPTTSQSQGIMSDEVRDVFVNGWDSIEAKKKTDIAPQPSSPKSDSINYDYSRLAPDNPKSRFNPPRMQTASPQILCNDVNDCPTQVGVMIQLRPKSGSKTAGADASDWGIAHCTLSIVGQYQNKSIVATNAHCLGGLPDDICAKTFAAKFPATPSLPGAVAFCERVLSQSPEDWRPVIVPVEKNGKMERQTSVGFARDYAFILLDRNLNRGHFNIRQIPVPNATRVYIPHIDYTYLKPTDQSESRVLVKTSQCITTMFSFLNPLYTHPLAPLFQTHGCALKLGASGAPVLTDSKTDLIGWLHTTHEDTSTNPSVIDLIASQQNMITRAGCAENSELGLRLDSSEACPISPEKKSRLDHRTFEDHRKDPEHTQQRTMVDAEILASTEQFIRNNSRHLRFARGSEFKSLPKPAKSAIYDLLHLPIRPTCYLDPRSWPVEPVSIRSDGTLTLQFALPPVAKYYVDDLARKRTDLQAAPFKMTIYLKLDELKSLRPTRALILEGKQRSEIDIVPCSH